MKIYTNSVDAIIDLHNKGFVNDFQLYGNDLLWSQEGIFIRAGEFTILEYHRIKSARPVTGEEVVFGILAPNHNVKGILLNHYKTYSAATPPVLVKKINEMTVRSSVGYKLS